MPATTRVRRFNFGKRPLLLFGVTVLLPGVVLAGLGLAAFLQDRRSIDQRKRERLDRSAERAVRALDEALRRWEDAVAAVPPGGSASAGRLPEALARVVSEPGAVVVLSAPVGPIVPARALPYDVLPAPSAEAAAFPPPAIMAIGRQELERQDYPGASAAYRRLIESGREDVRPWALHGLGRTLAKTGRTQEAVRAYEELGRVQGARIGGVDAGLVGISEGCRSLNAATSPGSAECALRLARDLVDGRWRLDKARFTNYTETVWSWLRAHGPLPADLVAALDQKSALAEAVELAVASGLSASGGAAVSPPRHRVVQTPTGFALAFVGPSFAGARPALLVLSPALMASRIWPDTFRTALSEGLHLTLVAPSGGVVFDSSATSASSRDSGGAPLEGVGAFQDRDFLWRVRVRPRDPARYFADIDRSQYLYGAMLGLMALSLLGGTVLTARAVAREVEVSRLKSRFVSAVSHEFRSPLTGIRQLAELLARGRVADENRKQDYYGMILRESDRLGRLVENVLDFARMEDGRKEYRLEPIETAAWLRAAAASFGETLSARDRTVETTVPDTLPAVVGDREALTGAVHNLLDNAVKYSPGSRAVWVDAESADGQVIIRVRDEGVGISAEDLPRVFDRFFRGAQLADSVRGTGLGLSLVKHVVDAHGGSIALESEPGTGTTFTLRLPVPLA